MNEAPDIDCVLLACTHYPLLMDTSSNTFQNTSMSYRREIVAASLKDYLSAFSNGKLAVKAVRESSILLMIADLMKAHRFSLGQMSSLSSALFPDWFEG